MEGFHTAAGATGCAAVRTVCLMLRECLKSPIKVYYYHYWHPTVLVTVQTLIKKTVPASFLNSSNSSYRAYPFTAELSK